MAEKKQKEYSLDSWCKHIRYLERERAVVYNKYQEEKKKLNRISGTSYDSVRVSGGSSIDQEEVVVKILDKMNKYRADIGKLNTKIGRTRVFSRRLSKEEKELFQMLYIENMKVNKVCEELNTNRVALGKVRKSILKKYDKFKLK